jgi:Ca-activated chloride channel family protein
MRSLIKLLKTGNQWLESNAARGRFGIPAPADSFQEKRVLPVTIVLLDVSPSMNETDYEPSRLEGAKESYRLYLAAVHAAEPARLVGLVQFHGHATLVCEPLEVGTAHEQLRAAADRLSGGSATNIGDALLLAAHSTEHLPQSARTIILLTDGASNAGPDPVGVADNLKAQEIQLDIVGIGGSPAAVREQDLKKMASVVNGELRYWFIRSVPDLVRRFEAFAFREIK